MTFEEYTQRLQALRKEYADSIRNYSTGDDFNFIAHAEHEATDYRLRVQDLMDEYHRGWS